jgi:hypothetical protein
MNEATTDQTRDELKAMMQREKRYTVSSPPRGTLHSLRGVHEEDHGPHPWSSENRARLCQWIFEGTIPMARLLYSVFYLCKNIAPSSLDPTFTLRPCQYRTVVNYYGCEEDIASIAINHVDRYVAVAPATCQESRSLQLLVATSLILAIKTHTVQTGPRVTLSMMLRNCRGDVTIADLEDTEMKVLSVLDWMVHPPTPRGFLMLYCILLQDTYPAAVLEVVYDDSLAMCETILMAEDPTLRKHLPSVLAVAILHYSMENYEAIGSNLNGSISPLAELHRHGIYVQALESRRCVAELLDFFEPSDAEDMEYSIEEKDSFDGPDRMSSPVGVSSSRQSQRGRQE